MHLLFLFLFSLPLSAFAGSSYGSSAAAGGGGGAPPTYGMAPLLPDRVVDGSCEPKNGDAVVQQAAQVQVAPCCVRGANMDTGRTLALCTLCGARARPMRMSTRAAMFATAMMAGDPRETAPESG